jgi:hypothetical protein
MFFERLSSDFPELKRFEDERQQRSAFKHAWNSIFLRGPLRWPAILVVAGVYAFLYTADAVWASSKAAFHAGTAAVILAAALYLATPWMFRNRLRKHLRRQLAMQNILICVECDYDMRGTASKKCPECGTPTLRCTGCGREYTWKTRRPCPYCGQPLRRQPE